MLQGGSVLDQNISGRLALNVVGARKLKTFYLLQEKSTLIRKKVTLFAFLSIFESSRLYNSPSKTAISNLYSLVASQP